ncbi:MAG TPA: peptidyl-alpha-hydroxyglycine alpha-amidating lyase family protein [Chloroflexota bacterium]|jgi:DNA-binding beta-propeller fold protein YncE|nr:peptidyl-alpha-hydroxyglycine alpha-amidating lyase family protein [Chloroflexota bacterium]
MATAMTIGSGPYTYEPDQKWHQMPDGDYAFIDVPAICVDSKDNVYAMNRGAHPIQVYDKQGKFVRSWGEGQFDRRAHGIHCSPDDFIWTVNDSQHCIKKYTPDGQLKQVIGTENQAAQKWSGVPFNRPTNVAISPSSGDVYVTDGYGNSRVHRFSSDGKHIVSWGSTGTEPGEFQIPHNVVIDRDENVFVTDRENNRLQVFDKNGKLQAIWHDIYRPQAMCMGKDETIYIGEMLNHPDVADCPGVGHRVNAYNKDGKRLARIGDSDIGDEPTQFIAPHGFGVDSGGNLYVGEVSFTVYGSRFEPKRVYKAFRKLIRKG